MGDTSEAPFLEVSRYQDLSDWLSSKESEGQVARTRLRASDRVIARVTDGIYRQPASALRELISNAWDADANNVTVLTDAPRFSRIYVRDDGRGMSHRTLARLLHQIGGSAKRREEGKDLGVTKHDDPDSTPGGRPLIGKIGIGLFSVSQLARRFRIITKQAGQDYRLLAEVRVRAYSEDPADDELRDADDSYVSGDVWITREPAVDIEAHGTDIILEDVKPRVRDLLRSDEQWRAVQARDQAVAAGELDTVAGPRVERPAYHAGWIEDLRTGLDSPAVLTIPPSYPWDVSDPADVRMRRLMDAVASGVSRTERPDLTHMLDAYLQTLWSLALSVPVRYVDEHPFDLTGDRPIRLFWLSNQSRGQAVELELQPGERVRDAVTRQAPGKPVLRDGTRFPAGEFKVDVDGVELRRPIRFGLVRTDRRGLDKALLFVGEYAPDLERIDKERRGGNLALEGYLFWNGRIIPKENNGVLVRIRGASGALFDPTFFQYQISEQTRLRQITSELFIQRGLDAALNIDRESFNFSHPHVQLVTSWVHRAIRQLTNKHKEISYRLRAERKDEEEQLSRGALAAFVDQVWVRYQGNEPAPDARIVADAAAATLGRAEGSIALSRREIASLANAPAAERTEREARAIALVRVLAAFGVLEDRSYEEQQQLIDAIMTVFFHAADR